MAVAGDRRAAPRFEIVGGLWGTFELVVTVDVLNISYGGLLVASPVHLERDAVHRLTVRRGELQAAVEVRVRHTVEAAGERGGESYLVGCEFVSRTSAMEALLMDGQAEIGGV